MVPLEHLVQQPPLQVFLGDGEDHHHEDVQRPGGLDHLERAIKDLFGKTLEVERDPSFDRESVMGHRGLKKFRGVTRHKRTQRYEAHIWESKKQIYLGGFESEMLAARSHDIMALKCKGSMCDSLNFGKKEYEEVMAILPGCDKEDIISCLRNYSKTYSQGSSHHHHHSSSSSKPHHYRLSVAKGHTLKIKKRHGMTGHGSMPLSPKQGNTCSDIMAPITPQCATGKESLLFDPVQPVDALCSHGVFLSPTGKDSTVPCDEQSPFASYGALDDTYILDSFSSEASHGGMDFGAMYEPVSDSVNLALTTSVALHDDDTLVPWLD